MTAGEEKRAGAGPVVLVADDDPDILALVSRPLQRAGYAVVTAEDGEEALRAVRERRPDLAIVDVRMPVIDGLELIRRIRADEQTREMAVIALSAQVHEAHLAEGFAAGADEYVRKPFSPRQLVELVGEKLSASQRG